MVPCRYGTVKLRRGYRNTATSWFIRVGNYPGSPTPRMVCSIALMIRPTSELTGCSIAASPRAGINRFLKRLKLIHKALRIQRPLFSTDLWFPIYALKVALDIRKQGCDLVHVYYYPQFANLIKWLNPNVRVVLNNHGESIYRVKYTDIKKRLRQIDSVISCSDFITQYTCDMFPEIADHCRTVPMGLSPDIFIPRRQSANPDNHTSKRLLSVSRIAPEKGIHVLLDAFELIIREHPEATLTLVGPEWIAPREDIVDLCLGKNVAGQP